MNAQMLWYSVETDAYRMAQQMALEYQGEEGTLLERVGCNYAAVTLKDGNIAVACWSDDLGGGNIWRLLMQNPMKRMVQEGVSYGEKRHSPR